MLRALKRGIPLILGVAALAFVLAWLWGSAEPELYSASAGIRVTPTDLTGDEELADRRVANAAFLLESTLISEPVIEELGIDVGAVQSVAVAPLAGHDTVEVTVVATDPGVAAAAANAHVDIYRDVAASRNAAARRSQAELLRGQADALNDQLAEQYDDLEAAQEDSTEARAIENDIEELLDRQTSFRSRANRLEAEATLEGFSASLASAAIPPTSPFAPQPMRNAIVVLVLALIIVPGLVLIREWLGGRISDSDEVDLLLPELPVLGSIPATGRRRPFRLRRGLPNEPRALSAPDSAAGEACRTLSTNLRFSSRLTKTTRRIAVTSPGIADGKSTVTANLAATLAASGLRVVIVSADLRRPSLGEFFDVDDTQRGLTSVLLNDATVGDCLVLTKVEGGAALGYLTPGPLPANPPALLGSDAFGHLLDQIDKAGVDVVLLDCPPVLPVSDALVAAQDVDGVLLVAAVNQTKKTQLVESVERLREVGAEIVGLVVNGVQPSRDRYNEGDYKPHTPAESEQDDDDIRPQPQAAGDNGSAKSGANGGPTASREPADRPGADAGDSTPATPPPD